MLINVYCSYCSQTMREAGKPHFHNSIGVEKHITPSFKIKRE